MCESCDDEYAAIKAQEHLILKHIEDLRSFSIVQKVIMKDGVAVDYRECWLDPIKEKEYEGFVELLHHIRSL